MKAWNYISLILVGLLAFTLTFCGGSSDGDGNTGKLSLSLSDAPAPEYQAVYVTISQIQVHRADAADGQWQTILTPHATYNLLDLINGTTAPLGVADLPTGTYTQMRLILADTPDTTTNILGDSHPYANYLITSADEPEAIELKVPSGFQTGIKLVHSFEVESGRTVGLVLDFDAGRSVVKAGNSGNWLLKPTIKVIGTVNNATLAGTVTGEEENPIPGATVSAQVYDADADEIAIVASTLTDSEGKYRMYLEPGTYTIVVTADEFSAAYTQVVASYDTDYTEDFTLTPSPMALITLDLTLPPETPEETATVEFRQSSPYGMIAVKDVNYSESSTDTAPYTVHLPDGVYDVVATCGGLPAIVTPDVEDGERIAIDFTE
ncbi:MAG: DUF4382 domain-containing protein [Syntrophaceae bacterium]